MQFFDLNGDPLSGGKVNTYEAGTSTRKATYTTAAASVANANPVILNSRGEANIFWSTGSYKIVLTDSEDAEIYTVDNVTLSATGTAGASFRAGSGVPSDALGSDGDRYLRTSNGAMYLKGGGVYSVESTLSLPASGIVNTPSGNLAADDVQEALNELQTELDAATAHIADSSAAHAASAISNTPSGNLAATDVQAALNELQTELDAATAHISDATDAHAGTAITNTPSGNLAATTAQAALNELQTDVDTRATSASVALKADAASPTFTGTITTPLTASRALVTGASSELAASSVTATELGYVSGVTSGIQAQINGLSAPSFAYQSKTTTYTAVIGECIVCSGASWTLTFPTAVGNAGKVIKVIHNGTSGSQIYTIDGAGAETVDGAADYKLYVKKQIVTLVSDGANWLISDSYYPAVSFQAYKNAGAVTANTTIPTWTGISRDTVGAFNSTTGVYTVIVPGDYYVSHMHRLTAATAGTAIVIVNGSQAFSGPQATSTLSKTVSGMLVGMVAGDTISVAEGASATLTSSDINNIFTLMLVR